MLDQASTPTLYLWCGCVCSCTHTCCIQIQIPKPSRLVFLFFFLFWSWNTMNKIGGKKQARKARQRLWVYLTMLQWCFWPASVSLDSRQCNLLLFLPEDSYFNCLSDFALFPVPNLLQTIDHPCFTFWPCIIMLSCLVVFPLTETVHARRER